MPDFVDAKLKEIQSRLAEIRPLVEEYDRLVAAESALVGLEGVQASSSAAAPAARAAAKPAPARRGRRPAASGGSSGGASKRRGRPKGSGTRSIQALELVRAQPGITIPELAERMAIKQNYLYRVMPELAKGGQVKKSGRGWHPQD